MATEHSSWVRRAWENVLTPGAHPGESAEQRGRRRILVGFLVISVPGGDDTSYA